MHSGLKYPRLAKRTAAILILGAGALYGAMARCQTASADTNQVFRFAISANLFPEVNENDARAAMKVWVMEISNERHIAVDPDLRICRDERELGEIFKTGRIDGVGLVTSEYASLSRTQKFDRLGVASCDGCITESYEVLVRRDGGVESLSQLAGRTLNVLASARASLAMTWLDTALVEAGQKRAADFFGPIRYQDKASLVALPVFFRQVDACLITSNSFKVMGELNPQLHKQLRVLALSPDVIPSFFAFCARDPSLVSPEVITAMTEMHQSTAGKQILTLVKADCIVERPVNCLQPSLDLLAKHDRLCGEATP